MNSRPRKPQTTSPSDVTLDIHEVESTDVSDRELHPVALVEGSGPQMSCETQCLLRSRLRAAALILCLGFAIFFLWMLISTSTDYTGLLVAHSIVTLSLGFCAITLCRRCTITTRILRIKEILVFGLPALYFIILQIIRMTECAAENQYLPKPAAMWLLLLFTYALFIPNTWRRAAAIIGVMGLIPVLVTLALFISDTACNLVLRENPSFIIEQAILMLVGSGAAVAGVHTIGGLRREAFEAKQFGQYRLRHLIGSGGMGEVYLAEHRMMKRPCAIKIIRPEKAGDPRVLARFEREVRASARLSHWNSIEIFDYGRTDDGIFYYVMEFLPGMNLQDIVMRYGALPAERVIHLLIQTCAGLQEAHETGLIHRDIKPANIFAAHRGGIYDVAKLLDFGLAKPLESAPTDNAELTLEGAVTGTPLYMSPEQATGDREPDARGDIYSLGAVAYFLLTGRPPFYDVKPLKVMISLVHDDVVPLSERAPDVPEDLERVIMRCLEKDPAMRYQSAAELAAALRDCDSSSDWSNFAAEQWWQEQGTPWQSMETLDAVDV